MNKQKRIAIDIDGVIFYVDEFEYLDFCAEVMGWNIDKEGFAKTHDWHIGAGVKSDEEIGTSFSRFITERNAQREVPGAKAAIAELAKDHEIYLITARVPSLEEITQAALETHDFSQYITKTIYCGHQNKPQALQNTKASILIDDNAAEKYKILETDFSGTLIQFPAFRNVAQTKFNDPRVYRLAVCDLVQTAKTEADKNRLWQAAWQETVEAVYKLTQ